MEQELFHLCAEGLILIAKLAAQKKRPEPQQNPPRKPVESAAPQRLQVMKRSA